MTAYEAFCYIVLGTPVWLTLAAGVVLSVGVLRKRG